LSVLRSEFVSAGGNEMTAINAGLAYSLGLQERPDPDRQSASASHPSHGSVTMETDWMTTEELNAAIRLIGSAFIAKVGLRTRGSAG
jgi:hypothetical protein